MVQSGLRRWIVTPEIAGSNPVVPASAEVAQPVEHGPEKAGVPSSTLGLGTISFLLLAEKSCNERFVALSRASLQWNGVRVMYCWSAVLMHSMWFGMPACLGITLWRTLQKTLGMAPSLWISIAGPTRRQSAKW